MNTTATNPPPLARYALRGAASLALAAVLFAGTATPDVSAETGIYVQVQTGDPGGMVEGEATAPGHEGWIEVLALGTAASTGDKTTLTRRGVPTLHDFSIVKLIDRSTPKLQEALFDGTIFPEVRIKHPLDGLHPGLVIILEEVGVRSYSTSGDADDRPTEEVAFYYNKITWQYRPDPFGQPETSTEFDLLFGTTDPGRDDDGDGIENILDPDDDNDGVHDEYELRHGLNPLFADGDYDDDDDDKTNYAEFLAGTDSEDANSFFAIRSISVDRESRVLVKLPTIGDRRYRVKSSFDMRSDSWVILSEFETDSSHQPGITELELPSATASQLDRLFLTVEVSPRTSAAGR